MLDADVKVLCIDDEEWIRFALGEVIESQGWRAKLVKNVRDAEKYLKENSPTIILIDYHMPDINGLEGVKIIRKYDESVPIVVFTIDSNQTIADKFLEAGATDFATKPIKAPDLISRIRLHIRLLDNDSLTENTITKNLLLPKGIGRNTLDLMIDKLSKTDRYLTVEEVADLTELSYQTTYRYLQFLEAEDIIDVKVSYGKIGRPKQNYKLKK